jgi:hypothetical protein
MGLDMYLEKKIFLGTDWDNKRKSQEVEVEDWSDNKIKIDLKDVREISFDAGYWRKANAIHNWFVENVQDGVDDCGDYGVSREQLKELLGIVNRVLKASVLVDGEIQNGSKSTENGWEPIMEKGKYVKNPGVAKNLLPTNIDGCFFGSGDYDQFYINGLKDTKKILEKALRDKVGDYHYSSSW